MNDPHFAMSIYEEAGDVYFKGHRNRMASLPFYRVKGYFKCTVLGFFFGFFFFSITNCRKFGFSVKLLIFAFRMGVCRLRGASMTSTQSFDC